MSDHLLNLIRREMERFVRATVAAPRVAIVENYDPTRNAARVSILPENVGTGYLPVLTDWMGNNWGSLAPLNPGDQVAVLHQEHDTDSGIILGRLFDARNPPPQGAGATERWLVHKSGTHVQLLDNGHLVLNGNVEIDATGPTINITATTVVNVTAPEINLGSAGETLHNLIDSRIYAKLDVHVHSNGNAGADTGPPTATFDSQTSTTVVSAG
jgi:phage baseplate assembly protein gpV